MRDRSGRRTTTRGRIGSAILATIVASMALVSVTSTTTSAAPVNTTINTSCGPRNNDPDTVAALNQAQLLIGSNRIAVALNITANDIPESAGLDQEIDARFNVSARLDQALIDGAAGLIPSIPATNLAGTLIVNGPSSVPSFASTAPNTTVTPVAGQPAIINLGTFGGPITTTGGGIITYRVGTLDFDSSLSVPSVGLNFNLKLRCAVQGSNLIARTTVRDPDAPFFDPEVIALQATGGETVTVDLLNDVVKEGKTPLLPESLEIVEQPSAGTASLSGGVFSFQAPNEPGTYSTTVQICGAPKPDSGIPGISEVQSLALGNNWAAQDTGGLTPRPIAFTLKVGEEETAQIETYTLNLLGLFNPPPTNRTPENWAPENRPGIVGDYVLTTNYRRPTAAAIQSALEALPSIGAGNVEVTDVRNESNRLTGFEVAYVNERAEQDIAPITIGQWYAVPPQEALDRINAAITGLLGGIGGDDEPAPPSGPLAVLIAGPPELSPSNPAHQQIVDTYMQQKIIAGLTNPAAGPTPADWDTWADFRIIRPLIDGLVGAAPDILSFLDSLFPAVIGTETLVEGEEATPPQPLCAQGIIDVTVAEVASEIDDPGAGAGDGGGPQVGGVTALPGAQPSFVG